METIVRILRDHLNRPPPPAIEDYNQWLEFGEVLAFLADNAREEELVVYASLQRVFINTVAIPSTQVSPPDVDDLLSWDFNAYGGAASIAVGYNPQGIWIERSLSSSSAKSYTGGTRLIFPRSFEGRLEETHYFEVLQEYAHLFDLHYVAERKAWCRFDEHGDIEDWIRVLEIDRVKDDRGGTVVLFKRGVLDEWMTLTGNILVRTYDFMRYRPEKFNGWSHHESEKITAGDTVCRVNIEKDHASYLRGIQIVRSELDKDDLYRRHSMLTRNKPDRQYESFIAYDFKNGVVREISTAPEATSNYFTKSDLPLEMSPVFFRPEVLQRYKADKAKYTLSDRTISCRSAWDLVTYDINEVGQVHTYIVYLRNLPHAEQLHWKAHNEAPKGPISKRAYSTDFKGEWHLEYDALSSLRRICQEWNSGQVPWWALRSDGAIAAVHYPVSASAEEWADELMNLDQLVVEGFQEGWLRQKARELGRSPDARLRSLKLLEECLVGMGFDNEHARQITVPLHRLHDLRSKLRGHASGEEAVELRRSALSQYKTYRKHYEALAHECDDALRVLDEAFSAKGKGEQ